MMYRFDKCKFQVGDIVRIGGTETIGAIKDRVSPPFHDATLVPSFDGEPRLGWEYEYRIEGVDPPKEDFEKGKVLLFPESQLELIR